MSKWHNPISEKIMSEDKRTQGEKRHDTMVDRYGSEEAYQAKLKEWASKGGKNSPSRLDKQTPERRREIASLAQAGREQAILRKYGYADEAQKKD